MMNEIELLREINENSQTGIEGLNNSIEKVQDSNLKKVLLKEKESYQNIYDRTKELLYQQGYEVTEIPVTQKAMSWMGIQLNTLSNKSNSKIAEILIQGNDMGIIKGVKNINNMKFQNSEIKNILEDFVSLQQKNIEELKKFL